MKYKDISVGKPKEMAGVVNMTHDLTHDDHQTLVALSALSSVVGKTTLDLEAIKLELENIKSELDNVKDGCKCANETYRREYQPRSIKRKGRQISDPRSTEDFALNCIGSDGLDWSAWKSPAPQQPPHAQSFKTWQECQQRQKPVSRSAIPGVVQPPVSQPAGAAFDDACKPGTVKTEGMINNIMVCDTNAGNFKKALFADSVNRRDSLDEIQIMKNLAAGCKGTSSRHLGCSHVAHIVSYNAKTEIIREAFDRHLFGILSTVYDSGATLLVMLVRGIVRSR